MRYFSQYQNCILGNNRKYGVSFRWWWSRFCALRKNAMTNKLVVINPTVVVLSTRHFSSQWNKNTPLHYIVFNYYSVLRKVILYEKVWYFYESLTLSLYEYVRNHWWKTNKTNRYDLCNQPLFIHSFSHYYIHFSNVLTTTMIYNAFPNLKFN